MDQHLEAMQRQLDQATAQNRLLALRLRQLAAGYRGMGSPAMGGMPLSGMGGMGGLLSGGGGLSGVSGLAAGDSRVVGEQRDPRRRPGIGPALAGLVVGW
ncbi:hypothetical protein O974_26935 [Mycobacterium avium 11-0986]|nr:hypothetical protein O974_26935 [Mycobacterium avium 11-0986]